METTDGIGTQLRDVQRLSGAAECESRRAPQWAWPVMSAAIVAFMAYCAFAPERLVGWGSLVWTVFVLGWVIATRRNLRAKPKFAVTRRGLGIWAVGTAAIIGVSYASVAIFGRTAWLFIGLAFGAWGLASGARMSRRFGRA